MKAMRDRIHSLNRAPHAPCVENVVDFLSDGRDCVARRLPRGLAVDTTQIDQVVTNRIVALLTRQGSLSDPDAAFVFSATESIQADRQHGPSPNAMRQFADRLTTHSEEFGAEGLVVVEGVKFATNYDRKNPISRALAKIMMTNCSPPVCFVGSGREIVSPSSAQTDAEMDEPPTLQYPSNRFIETCGGVYIPEPGVDTELVVHWGEQRVGV